MCVDFRMWTDPERGFVEDNRSLLRSTFKLMLLTVWRKSFLSGICFQCWWALQRYLIVTVCYLQLGFKETHWLRGGFEESRSHVLHEQLTYRLCSSQTSFGGVRHLPVIIRIRIFFAVFLQNAICTNKQMTFVLDGAAIVAFKSLLLSHHSNVPWWVNILESVLQTVQKQLTYRQYQYIHTTYTASANIHILHYWMCNLMTIKNTIPTLQYWFSLL